MPMFKVIGSRTNTYYMDVSAEDSRQAYDIAFERDTNDWSEIETDNIIEIVEVLEEENE